MVEFDGVLFLLLALPLVDDELALKVRHELHVLLLLVRADHLQLVPEEGLELLLQCEGERQPAHAGGFPALPEVHDPLRVVVQRLFVFGFGHRYPIAAQEYVAIH